METRVPTPRRLVYAVRTAPRRAAQVMLVLFLFVPASAATAQSAADLNPIRSAPEEQFTVDVGVRDWGPSTIAGNTLVAGGPTGKGGLFAIDVTTGKLKWSYRPTDFNPSVSTPPVVVQDLVLAPMGAPVKGALVAVSLTTGKLRWRGPDPVNGAGVAVLGSLAYIVAKDGALHALDVATGQERWRTPPFNTYGNICASRPVIADGVLYLTASVSTGPTVFDVASMLLALDATTGTERWRHVTAMPDGRGSACVKQPVVDATTVYAAGRHVLFAVDRQSGRARFKPVEFLATVNGKVQFRELAGLVDAGPVLVGMIDDALVVLDKSNGKTVWSLPGEYTVSQPAMAVAGSVVYFQGSPRTAPAKAARGTLHALDLDRLTILWSFSRPTAEANWAFGSVTPVDGALWVDSYKAMVKLR